MRYLNPIIWARWFGNFLSLWFLSIPWQRFSHALPALVLLIAIISGSVIAISEGSGWRNSMLDSQIISSWESDDFDTTELLIRRKLAASPEDNRAIYQLARTFDAQKQHDQAQDLMRQLVRVKEHEDAARWLLQKSYFGRPWEELDDREKDEFGNLLRLIHKHKPNDLRNNLMYADYLVLTKRYAQSIPILERLARDQPMRGLQAAAIARSLGKDSQANLLAKQTLTAVRKKLDDDPTNTGLAVSVARNQLFLDQYQEAVDTLSKAYPAAKTTEDQQLIAQSLGETFVAWIRFIEQAPVISTKQRIRILQLLEAALKVAPNNPRVLEMVADEVLATAKNENEEIVILRQSLIGGTSPGIAHFIQGTTALLDNNSEEAIKHLKIAAQLMPHSSAILNNLAFAMADDESTLEEALKFSESAIEQSANPPPHFFETRGQILRRMGRHLEAISDLELALKHPSLAENAHRALAECYEKIGDERLSAEHRAAADRQSSESQLQTLDPRKEDAKTTPSATPPSDG